MLDKATMQQALRMDHCRVTFNKKDGEERIMDCTLRPRDVVPYEKKTDRPAKVVKENILPVWDLTANAWRSFDVDRVTNFEMLHV